ncbi:substrate-binding periplasmic protein [Aliiglaciecola lipolytica]|uniref:Uncharacterized protein n=1 Tax=Aliiglaciecola lipolytica E3 TaxID=1127673 RepID=K6YJQ1_9ALTE|nr:transporter substrate-binding domain-containing protein [Aliiglaciecola lipolytica]GAC16813.1 hypothetical protein GLIP_4202 [Aliiglaciecola lipolytica E3]
MGRLKLKKATFCLFLMLFCSSLSYAQQKSQLTLATTHWCPYTCGDGEFRHGTIGVYIQSLLKELSVELNIEYYPWSRAILLAKHGQVDGLLTATYQEAPSLTFTDIPVSYYQMCFFTKRNTNWRYTNPIVLGNLKLAVIQDYGYGEPVDTFLRQTPGVIAISGSAGTQRLIDFLRKSRVDIIIEDDAVYNWAARHHDLDVSEIRNAGCLPSTPFYLALYPSEENLKLIKQLNQVLRLPKNQQRLQQIMAIYSES